ncbi:MAG: putative maltokinase, partial [Bryobacteraceae bacterium]
LGDRNGVRTPMQWTSGPNAGFSEAEADLLYLPVIASPEYHYETFNVDVQRKNPFSLLWWTRNLIALRKKSKALTRGSIEFLRPENSHVLAFIRSYEEEQVMVVANLSRFAQPVELNLSQFSGCTPVEMFGRAEFPPVRKNRYALTLTPYSFYWFELRPPVPEREESVTGERAPTPEISVPSLDSYLTFENGAACAALLPPYLRLTRWFRNYVRTIASAKIIDIFAIRPDAALVVFDITFAGGDPETYMLPLGIARAEQAEALQTSAPETIIARLRDKQGKEGLLHSSAQDSSFSAELMDLITSGRAISGHTGELRGQRSLPYHPLGAPEQVCLLSSPLKGDQRNTSIIYGDLFVLKLFRKLEEGPNPEVELGRFLFERTNFGQTAPVVGTLEYKRNSGEFITAGVAHAYVTNEGDLWRHTRDALAIFLQRALAQSNGSRMAPGLPEHPLDLLDQELPPLAAELMQTYLEEARLLGRRTAEMHMALGSDSTDEIFAPESSTHFYRQGSYHALVGLTKKVMQLLRKRRRYLPEPSRQDAEAVLRLQAEIQQRFRTMRDTETSWTRIRVHGDFHLGQVLYTGRDFVFIDFEGENTRPVDERRIKRSPMRDVAGMIRSFHYAATSALFGRVPGIIEQPKLKGQVESWAHFWYMCASAAYLKGYIGALEASALLPPSREQLRMVFDMHHLDKAIYELGYELNSRPEWAPVALRGVLEVMGRRKLL